MNSLCFRAAALAALFLGTSAVAAPVDAGIIALPLQPTVSADKRSCSAKTASGLGHAAMRAGEGRQAAADDVVLVNYIGYLSASGIVFDQGMGQVFPVDEVIPGFTEGLQLLAKGSIARLCIPSTLGYGAQGAGTIPANADLVFQVELVDLRSRAEIEGMRAETARQQAAPAPVPAPVPATPTPPKS